MCFLGSAKYPGEDEYKTYLSQHGGRSNASTSMHLTTYKCEILAAYAAHAVDLFSQFFVAPLFTASGTGREVNAVDSENSKNLVSDGRRRLQILKAVGDPNHYYTKFSTGNAQTLPTEERLDYVRSALLAFHRKHYRPEHVSVVLAGPQSLDTLQQWAVDGFGQMPTAPFPTEDQRTEVEQLIATAATDAPPYHFAATTTTSPTLPVPFRSPFRPDNDKRPWPYRITTKPVRSMRKLDIMFPLPSVHANPDRSPIALLSHLLGHEGPQSAFAILQETGWLSSLSAGNRASGPDFSLFHVEIGLTETGEERWKDVVNVVFQHCRLVADAATTAAAQQQSSSSSSSSCTEMERLWGENAKLNAMFFDQASPKSVYSVAPALSQQIVVYGTEMAIAQGSMLQESETTAPLAEIAEFAQRLVPSNCMIERCSEAAWNELVESERGTVQTEPWYGIDYIVSDVDPADQARWEGKATATTTLPQASLALPQPNRYIPRTMELCSELPPEARHGARIDREIVPPQLVLEKHCGRLWHKLDDRYALPKSWLSLLIRNAAVENVKEESSGHWTYDTTAAIQSSLIASMFDAAMAVETYDASLAGLGFNLSLGSDGIRLTCSGFSDRLSEFAKVVLQKFVAGDFLQELHFLSAQDRTVRLLKTYLESRRGDSQAIYFRDFLLGSHGLGLDQSIKFAELATLQSVKDHHQRLLSNNEVLLDCLYSGNVSETEAKDLFESLYETSCSLLQQGPTPPSWIPGSQERRLELGTSTELHFENRNVDDENGAVVVSFQSPVPSFRGEQLSPNDSLVASATIRLLCQMLRGPLFDELRTKQTLGYIVSAYYDLGVSSTPAASEDGHWSVPVDFVVIDVLSRKAAPDDLLRRIDTFLRNYRTTIANMPASEVEDFSSALSTKLLKPFQDLKSEASIQFTKIRRHAPEVLAKGQEMPWDNSKTVAATLRSLQRQDILQVYDSMLLSNKTRTRIVSSVYGKAFPMDPVPRKSSPRVLVNDMADMKTFRNTLEYFDLTPSKPRPSYFSFSSGNAALLAVGVGAVVAGVAVAFSRSRKATK